MEVNKRYMALALTLLVGATLGVIVGYFVDSASAGAAGSIQFRYWIRHPINNDILWWAAGGAAISAAILYIRQVTR